MSRIFESRSALNRIRSLKKRRENSTLLSKKELDEFNLKINLLHSRSKSQPSQKKVKEYKLSLEQKIEKRFKKIDNTLNTINTSIKGMKGEIKEMKGEINEMKGSIDNLFILSILKANIPGEKDKNKIKKYITEKYKKLLPKILNDPPSDINNEDNNQNNISKKNTNNNIKANDSSFVGRSGGGRKNIDKIISQSKREYKGGALNKKKNNDKKKYSFRKKSNINKSSNSSNQNTNSLESINKFLQSNTKYDEVGGRVKDNNNEKNMGENFKKINININNLLKKETRIANIFNSNTNNNQTKNTEKKNIYERKNNELKQYKGNANMKNSKKKYSNYYVQIY